MPHLYWLSKEIQYPSPAKLRLDSVLYPISQKSWEADIEDRLILGENLAVMQALLPEYENRIDLIYVDPPFFSNRNYSTRLGRGEDSRKPDQWQLGEGYPDAWGSLDDYLDMLYPRLVLMHRLLSPQGTLYLHLDWHADAYARLLLDEIFGADRLLNEIIWVYHGPSPIRRAFNRKHDTILVYTKSENYIFNVNDIRLPYAQNTITTFKSSAKAGFGKVPDLERGKVPEDWWYFPVIARLHSERTGYPTQKPAALLERIIRVSSRTGSFVADFFGGSGTTALEASKLNRRFLVSDVSWRAVHTARVRLANGGLRPFQIYHEESISPAQSIPTTYVDADQIVVLPSIAGFQICLGADLAKKLDYWEVDPEWNGENFHSKLIVSRSFHHEGISTSLLGEGNLTADVLAVRLVYIDGTQKSFIVPINRNG